MHFISWLEQQNDLRITRLLMRDYNNGCLPPVKNVAQLRKHFIDKHYMNSTSILALIEDAFVAYKEELAD